MVLLMGRCSYSLMELPGDGLTGEETTLTDQELTTLVKCSTSQHDLLSAVFEKSPMALLQEAKQEAHEAGTETLMIVSTKYSEIEMTCPYQAKSDDERDVTFLA